MSDQQDALFVLSRFHGEDLPGADVHGRLVRCFSAIFPVLTEEEIQAANLASMTDLDSLATVTLVTVIDEEFGGVMNPDTLLKLGTFQAVEQHLREQVMSSAPRDEQRVK